MFASKFSRMFCVRRGYPVEEAPAPLGAALREGFLEVDHQQSAAQLGLVEGVEGVQQAELAAPRLLGELGHFGHAVAADPGHLEAREGVVFELFERQLSEETVASLVEADEVVEGVAAPVLVALQDDLRVFAELLFLRLGHWLTAAYA